MDLRPAVAKLRMIEVSRVVGSYFRMSWENDVYRVYFDGQESGSRHAWSFAINGRPTLFAVHTAFVITIEPA